jgi:hypothetical protein
MRKHWQDRPGDWWLHTKPPESARRPHNKARKKRKTSYVDCVHCEQSIPVQSIMRHQRSDRCRIAQRERDLAEKGYVKYRWGTQKIELARMKVVVADKSIWVPRWAMITIHSMHAWRGCVGNAWAYQEAFDAVAENTDRQQLIETIAAPRGKKELVSPSILLTLRKCDMVTEATLNNEKGFGALTFRANVTHCNKLIDAFPEMPLSQHVVLAVSATLSHKIFEEKIRQRPDFAGQMHSVQKSTATLEEVVRKVGGHNALRPYLEESLVLDA